MLCAANNYDFMTRASSTRGGIGREAAKWFTTGFATKVALARSEKERGAKSSHHILVVQRTARLAGSIRREAAYEAPVF